MIRFQILQIDAGAEQYIGFAKSQANRLINAGIKSFTRTWPIGDVKVVARSIDLGKDVFVKMWLTGVQALDFWYQTTAEIPCKGRRLNIVGSAPPFNVHIGIENHVLTNPPFEAGFQSYTEDVFCTVNGVEVGRVQGGLLAQYGFAGNPSMPIRTTWNLPGFTTNSTAIFRAGPAPSGSALYNEDPTFYQNEPNGGWFLLATNASWSTPFDAAIANAKASIVSESKVRVLMNDGVELASVSVQKLTYPYSNLLHFAGAIDGQHAWSGGNFVRLFNQAENDDNTVTLGEKLFFEVPEDAEFPLNSRRLSFYPKSGFYIPLRLWSISLVSFDVSTDSGEHSFSKSVTHNVMFRIGTNINAPHQYSGSVRIDYSIRDDFQYEAATVVYQNFVVEKPDGLYLRNGSCDALSNTESLTDTKIVLEEPHGPFSQEELTYFQEWSEGVEMARTRERARRKKCSDETIDRLLSGPLPETILRTIRDGRPKSQLTRLIKTLTATVSTSHQNVSDYEVIDTNVVDLYFDEEIIGEEVYSAPVGVVVTVLSQSGEGAGKKTVVRYSQNITGTRRRYRSLHFTNGGVQLSEQQSPFVNSYSNWLPILPDGSSGPTDEGSMHGGDNYAEPASYRFVNDHDDTLAQIQNGDHVTDGPVEIAQTVSTDGETYNPPLFLVGDKRVYSHPEIYIFYRSKFKPTTKLDQETSSDWVDSILIDGEEINVYPCTFEHSDYGDLGMFPFTPDTADVHKISVVIGSRATYKYDYERGEWSFMSSIRFDGSQNLDGTVRTSPVRLPLAGLEPESTVLTLNLNQDDVFGFSFPNVVIKSKATPWVDTVETYKSNDYSIRNEITEPKFHLFRKLRDLH